MDIQLTHLPLSRLLDMNKHEGFMVLQIPRPDMVSPSDKLRAKYNYIFPVALLFIFALFILISTFFFYRIRKRLLLLQEVMETPTENGIPSPIEVTKQDEIGRLEYSFNRMIQELETSRKREIEEEELRKGLIANLSHDLRTPLTTIRAHAYRLKKESLSTKGEESLGFIDEKAEYMGELIENLLSYTLLTTGKYPYYPENVDIVRHYAIKVAPFNRAAVTARLQELGAKLLPSPDEPDGLRFADNNGIVVELKVV